MRTSRRPSGTRASRPSIKGPMAGSDVRFTTRDGETFDGYLTRPNGEAGILLITAVFGVDQEMRDDRQPIKNEAARSAIITAVRCVFARGMTGMTDASTTESPSTPMNRQRGSTTADGSSGEPIRHDPAACT